MRSVPALAMATLLLTAGCAEFVGPETERTDQFDGVDLSNTSQVDGLFDQHREALAAASSYTANATYYRNGSIHRYERVAVVRSDRTAEIVDRYFESGDRQERVVSSEEFREDGPWSEAVQLPIPQFVAGFQFEQVETADDAVRYEADSLYPDAPIEAAESVSGTLALNDDGVVTRLSVTIDYEPGHELERQRYVYEVDEVGSTEIDESD